MKKAFFVFLVTLVSISSYALAYADESKWEKTGESDGIQVFKKEYAGNPVVGFRGDAVIDAPILRVASVLIDEARSTEWVQDLLENKILRKLDDYDYVLYNHVGMPFIFVDREFVSKVHVVADKPNQTFDLSYEMTDDPAAPKTNYVRGDLTKSRFFLRAIEGGKKTEIDAEILCDPKGAVPKWLVNLFQGSWPEDTIHALRKQVAKPDIRDDARLLPFFK